MLGRRHEKTKTESFVLCSNPIRPKQKENPSVELGVEDSWALATVQNVCVIAGPLSVSPRPYYITHTTFRLRISVPIIMK